MKRRILAYLIFIDNKIAEYKKEPPKSVEEIDTEISRHLIQISMFQHERLIHLIVTVLFAIITIFTILYNIICQNQTVFILIIALFVLLLPYIKHYYLLENGVQKMYLQYDEMLAIKDSMKKTNK
ncbi:MAG: hypothetical protein K6G26_00125 [Lachnospiraceae bacterium]|nr:hypothetical protein [Lachnospiraceae bacterium]